MTALNVFTYTDQQVRTVLIDGDPWFVASDVATALGYSATAAMTRSMDDDEKGMQTLHTPGGTQTVTVINEAGLYSAIIRSTIPTAKSFKRWVTHEVLPTIRKTGQYVATKPEIPATYAQALRAAADAVEAQEKAEAELAIAAPKIESFDAFMESAGHYTMEAAAKSLSDVTGGLGRNKLFALLRAERILMSNNSPYQQYSHWFKVVAGTFEDKRGVQHATKTTHVRPEGLDALRRRFGGQA